jgi:uncharacterized membrane protein
MRKLGVLATLLIITIVVSSWTVIAQSTSISYIYTLGPLGDAMVKIRAYDPSGILVLTLPLEPGALNDTILVYDAEGAPLDFTVENGTLVIDAANSTTVWVEYSAILGNASDTVVTATIHPRGDATVYLPKGAALLGFNGTPTVDYVSNRIVLRYSSPGTYQIIYLAPSQTSITQTITTTTTPRTTSKTASTPAPTQSAPATSSTPAQSTTPGATTSTQQTTEQAAHSTPPAPSTSAGPAQPSPSSTTSTPLRKEGTNPVLIGLAVLIVIVVLIALFFARRSSHGSASPSSSSVDGKSPGGGSGPVLTPGTEILVESGLDDRDKAIIDLLRKEGPMGVSEVARRLGISKSTAWRKLQKLVDMGILERVIIDGSPVYRLRESSQAQ